MKCRPNGQTVKSRKWRHLCGVSNGTVLGVFNNTLSTGHRAFMERYFYCKTASGFQPALAVDKQAYTEDRHLREFWQRVVDDVGFSPVAEMQSVVNSYTGGKRKIYQKAMLDFYANGVCAKDAMLKSFVKFEKQNLAKAPRVINPRSPIYNLLLGCYIKCLEKKFFKAINTSFGSQTSHTVIKGLDNVQAAQVLHDKWNSFGTPVAVGLDATKFDMHVSIPALSYEHLFYLAVHTVKGNDFDAVLSRYMTGMSKRLPDSCRLMPNQVMNGQRPLLSWLLRHQLTNRGKAYFKDGTLQFTMEGTRSSGDMNTSLGNCILMCALIYAWARRVGVHVELANNGDDCVVIMESEHLSQFQDGLEEYFTTKGFRMQVEAPVYEFEQIEFCQSHPIFDGSQFKMVRNVDTSLIKNAMCLVPIANEKDYRKWLGAVGQCEGVLSGGIPIMQEFAAMYRRLGLRVSNKYITNVMRGTGRAVNNNLTKSYSYKHITDEARLSFYKGFGILPDHQVEIENYYKSITVDWTPTFVDSGDAMDKPLFRVPSIFSFVDPANLTW